MKRTITQIALVLLGFSSNLAGQENIFYNIEMINSLMFDTLEIKDEQLIKEIKSLKIEMEFDQGIPSKMFPFSAYDSVVLYQLNSKVPLYLEYENEEDKKNNPKISIFEKAGQLNKELLINGFKLTEKQIKELLEILNVPTNFDYGYIASCNFTIGLIAFYWNGEIVSYIHIDSMLIFSCYPMNLRLKHGLLKREPEIMQFFNDIGFKLVR